MFPSSCLPLLVPMEGSAPTPWKPLEAARGDAAQVLETSADSLCSRIPFSDLIYSRLLSYLPQLLLLLSLWGPVRCMSADTVILML